MTRAEVYEEVMSYLSTYDRYYLAEVEGYPEPTIFVIAWIDYMIDKYGTGTVYEKGGLSWDWGQALARECYGPDWNSLVEDNPTEEDMERAIDWALGDWPDWVDMERMGLK